MAANRVSVGLALLYAGWIGGLLLWTHRPRGSRPVLWLHPIAIVMRRCWVAEIRGDIFRWYRRA